MSGVSGFRHAGISVKNMEASLAFYSGLLGLTVISDRVSADGGRFVGAAESGVRICLLQIPDSPAKAWRGRKRMGAYHDVGECFV